MKKSLETCKNCELQFKTGFSFCPHCGQQVNDELTVKVLFYNTISNYFSFDARFLKSIFPLLFKPGFLAVKFIEGKRLLYLHPAQMYLFVTVVFFFLFSFVQKEQVNSIDESMEKASIGIPIVADSILNKELGKDEYLSSEYLKLKDSLSPLSADTASEISDWGFSVKRVDSLITVKAPDESVYKAMGMEEDAGLFTKRLYAQGLKFYKSRKGGSILQAFYDMVPIAMFFLLPIFALLLKLLYMNRRLYAHHLVFSFYYFSFLFVVFGVMLAVNFIFDIPDGIDFLICLSTFVYLVLALKRFYGQGFMKSFVKGSIVSFLFLLIVAPITVFVLGMYAFLFF